MALLRCDFFSDVLGFGTSMTVLLPDTGTDFPTLYLLHGLTDDDTAWTRNTSVGRYAADRGIAVVMPQVHRSFYTDEVWGRPYWTFVSEELPGTARRLFRLSGRREDTFVAGLSMGGYGALKLALRHPGRFAAAASLSGVLDLATRIPSLDRPVDPHMWQRIFGDPASVPGTGDDLFHLLGTVADPPALYVARSSPRVSGPRSRTWLSAAASFMALSSFDDPPRCVIVARTVRRRLAGCQSPPGGRWFPMGWHKRTKRAGRPRRRPAGARRAR